jgi:hypothetical protein
MKKNEPSFKAINYMFRPKKQIERKILIEFFQNMQHELKINISEYQYIGLGSIYYYDFILFHKYLNIRDMVSLDNKKYPKRFIFNKPFDFIKFKNISTTKFLSDNELDKKSFIWFDYDSRLINYRKELNSFNRNTRIFEDIQAIANRSKDLDLFVLTVNVNINEIIFDVPKITEAFINEYDEYLPKQYKKVKKITRENYPYIIQNIIINIFRNNEKFHPVKFKKLFSFIYQDGAPMYTIGGIFSKNDLPDKFIENDSLSGVDENKLIDINVPLLTYCEKMKLDQNISAIEKNLEPLNEEKIIELLDFEMETNELKNYINYHRYYPQYYEGII